jgi:hypothetical protein
MEDVRIFYGRLVYLAVIWYIFPVLVYFMAIWYILRLFGIFYGYLVYFTVIWYILRLFSIFYGYLVYFSRFGMLYIRRKVRQPWFRRTLADRQFLFQPGTALQSYIQRAHDNLHL